MTPGRAALVSLMRRYLAAMMDTSISLLEVHKLMYFLQESGQPLRLRYVKGHYGPFAENLRHVLREVDGHMVAGYRDGDAPDAPLHEHNALLTKFWENPSVSYATLIVGLLAIVEKVK